MRLNPSQIGAAGAVRRQTEFVFIVIPPSVKDVGKRTMGVTCVATKTVNKQCVVPEKQ